MSDTSAAAYIHKVQHLIEECILFKMSKEECMEALSKHANILPVITSTVWTELEKENKEFFEDYHAKRAEEKAQMSISGVDMLREKIEKMVLDSSSK
ncbi:hypothetical protein DCAR_0625484 [Daucus carota subsp. sativus]|uniref:Angiotensin-converting enzyme 2 n=1 Tax=Daucus carota subsp. sativus TaxID=79200 RepID=A0A164WH69_DAUCS|nr:PREDICTED: uncharacterized protein LOC108227146 isoform X2 [Daucus carota subsp. sativus]WOH06061.1 hypothetical protein DCAR_0625484 [Daucus carota subsp. sativus]